MFGQKFAWHQVLPHGPDQVQLTNASNTTCAPRVSVGEVAPQLLQERASARFRIAYLALVAQGLSIGVLGGVALAWSMANLRFGSEGIQVLFLMVTPLHGALLLAGGALSVLACLGRSTTVGFSVVAAVGWATLTVVSAVEAAHHAPGVLGFDPRDTLLYGVLAVYNLTICLLLVPTLRRVRRASARSVAPR